MHENVKLSGCFAKDGTMNRRKALSHLAHSLGLCALVRWPNLSAQTVSNAAVEATPTLDDDAAVITSEQATKFVDKAEREDWRVLPPLVKPPQQPLGFPAIVGKQVREPVSNTVIECVSNNPGYAHDYPISSPENADSSLLMLHNYSTDPADLSRNQDIIVDADTLEVVRDKKYQLGPYRRWSHTDPDTLFCLIKSPAGDQKLAAYHPSNDSQDILFDFNEAGYIKSAGSTASFGQGGGVQDWNDRFMPVSISNGADVARMLVVDLVRKRVHSEVDWASLLTREAINIPATVRGQRIPTAGEDASFSMSRDGAHVVVFRGGLGTVEFNSMYEVYRNDFSERREVGAIDKNGKWATMHITHATTGVDLQGKQVICGLNSPGKNHYIEIDTLDITHYPASGWGHTSVSKGLPGQVATYGYSTAFDNPEFNGTIAMTLSPLRKHSETPSFSPDDHELPVFEGAPDSEIRQYGYHRSIGTDYLAQPHMALTTRGDKAYFVSNHSGNSRGYRIFADGKSAK